MRAEEPRSPLVKFGLPASETHRIVERYFETMAERAAINAALYDHEVRAERAFIAARAQVAPTVIPEPVASQPVLSVVIKDESPDLRALFGLR